MVSTTDQIISPTPYNTRAHIITLQAEINTARPEAKSKYHSMAFPKLVPWEPESCSIGVSTPASPPEASSTFNLWEDAEELRKGMYYVAQNHGLG